MASAREKTLARLKKVPTQIRQHVRKVIEAEAKTIVDMQKRLVAVDSGALRNSIRYEIGDVSLASSANLHGGGGARRKGSKFKGSAGGIIAGDPDLTATIVAGDREAFYARFVEFGTQEHPQGGLFKGTRHPGTAPQPFFYGPYRARKKQAKRAVSTAIRKAVKETFT